MNLIVRSLICLCFILNFAHAAKKEEKPVKPLPEMCMGNPDAPVTVIDYSSLTCGHCAEFHKDVLPLIEENYVKTGKVRLIFRDFPGDKISVVAHQLAWGCGQMKYLELIKLFYKTQDQWIEAKDPVKELKKIAEENGGMTQAQVDKCLKNTELLDKIIHTRLEGQKKYNITATPNFIIQGKIYDYALTYDEFKKIVDPLIKASLKKDKKKNPKKKD